MRLLPPLLASLLAVAAPLPAAAGGLGLPNRQVVLEGTVDSIEYLEDMLDLLGYLDPGDRPAPAELITLAALTESARQQTTLVVDAIENDPELGTSLEGGFALDFLADGLDQLTGIDLLLDLARTPTVRALEDAIQEAIDLQVASLGAVQGRPDRFAPGRRFDDEVEPHWHKLGFVLERLADNGIPFDPTAFFEGFVVRTKPKLALERLGFAPDDGIKLDFKGGSLRLRGVSKLPFTGGVAASFALPDQFTLFASYRLPEKLSGKKLEALLDYSVGLYLASEAGPSPAASFVIEHQTTQQGFLQSFVAQTLAPQPGQVLETFPHASVSLTRRLRAFAVKDGDSLRLGILYREGDVELIQARDIPYLGALPYLSLYFRNGTKRTTIEIDSLLILTQPYVVTVPEL
jgi:hypothetical protein